MNKEKMRIHLDFSNVMEENIGEQFGLSKQTLEDYQTKITPIHHDFLRRRERGEFAFMNLPTQKEMLDEIYDYIEKTKGKFDYYVHLGIGGSALGPISLHSALRHPYYNQLSAEKRNYAPKMFFLDNIDPDTIASLFDIIDVKKTLFTVVTKSGGTAETIASYLVFLKELKKQLGEGYKENVVFITDPLRSFLLNLAREEGIKTFSIDPAVGGRFTVLTPVGLFPAAISGIDVNLLLDGAAYMTKICQHEPLFDNPAYMFGLINYLFYLENRKTVVMMPYSDKLYRLADWFRQLWAESLGKENNRLNESVNIGPLPVNALGATDQHSQVQLYMEGPNDKLFSFFEVEEFDNSVQLESPYLDSKEAGYLHGKSMHQLIQAEKQATEIALTENKRPNITFKLPEVSPFTVGQLFQIFEVATAFTGELFDINAFDQPGVEAGKIATYALMGRAGFEKDAERIEKKKAEKKLYLV